MGELIKQVLRILIVEDHALVRAGLRMLVERDPDFLVVGECDNGRDAVRAVGELRPKVVMMDLTMPGMNGIEAIADIKRRYPDTRVLVVTLHKTEEFVVASLRAGADGYILKEAKHEELRNALKTLAEGKKYLSGEISAKIANMPGQASGGEQSQGLWETLTQREREVLKLVAEGRTNKEIGAFLFLSVKTVEKHRAKLMTKLGVQKAAGLTAYAIEKGLLAL